MKFDKEKLRKRLIIVAIVLVVIAGVLGSLATFWTEYQWFDHLGFSSVYLTRLFAQIGTGVGFGVVALLVLALHVRLIKRFSRPKKDWKIPTPEGEIDLKEIVAKVSTPVIVTAAVVVAAGMGYWASMHWEDMLKFLHQTSFGHNDPELGKDIGFYLFTLPAMQFTQQWLVFLTGGAAVLSAAFYVLRGEIEIKERDWPVISPQVRGHLLFALACALGAIAWGYRIEMFEVLFSKRGVAYGATYTDVTANLPFYRIMIALASAVAVFLLYAIKAPWKGSKAIKYPAFALAAVVVVFLLGTFVWPTIVQRVIVNPNELAKEQPYLVHAISHTRNAYGLDKVEVKEFAATDKLTMKDLNNNKPTIDNIKIWDHRPLRATYRQLQVIRLYYDFPNISVDRYRIGKNYWQVMLSARELVHSQLEAQARTWLNQHLTYTHGYGVCLSPVNRADQEGLPSFWVKDIPPEPRHPDLKIRQPEIYYGLSTNDYVLTKTTEQEFDYPKGKENRYTTYSGKGGVAIGSFFRQLLFSLRFGDLDLFFTSTIKDDSRVLFYRNIQERVENVAPFLMLDHEPYVTIIDGRIKWIQDAYTVSYRYPYSQPKKLGRGRRLNYIRNSVKAVVDAYDGTISLYIWDEKDPMIQTYAKMFPKLFKKRSEASESLKWHVRYPKDLFRIQAEMYESFHMTDPRVWYNQEDKWNIAAELAEKTIGRTQQVPSKTAPQRGGRKPAPVKARQKNRMSPYYMIMRLPGQSKEEFLLMLPYTPRNKDNMVAWMTARCDGDNYGKLLVYTFPKKKLVFGPMQIEARIDQDKHISQWITLRNQQGSRVIRGDLLVIPIEDSILYVEPIYLQATQAKLPELKQVIVAYGQKIAMRSTLNEALSEVFGGKLVVTSDKPSANVKPTTKPTAGDTASLAKQALSLYRQGEASLAKQDWSAYGRAQNALKAKLEQLAAKIEPQLKMSDDGARADQPSSGGKLVLTLSDDGKLTLANKKVPDLEALKRKLVALKKQRADVAVTVRASNKLAHAIIIKVMDTIKTAGIQKVSMDLTSKAGAGPQKGDRAEPQKGDGAKKAPEKTPAAPAKGSKKAATKKPAPKKPTAAQKAPSKAAKPAVTK
jgi:uncharacterized membrane protein (UPF0182 family)/biopolymer transport protein ExbD